MKNGPWNNPLWGGVTTVYDRPGELRRGFGRLTRDTGAKETHGEALLDVVRGGGFRGGGFRIWVVKNSGSNSYDSNANGDWSKYCLGVYVDGGRHGFVRDVKVPEDTLHADVVIHVGD